jgi:hypothetical protein
LYCITIGDAHTRLNHWRAVEAALPDCCFFGWQVPAIIGSNRPVKRR